MDGFGDNDSVRFGDAVLSSGQLAVGAHSVSVIELNVQSDGSATNQTGGNETGGNETGGNETGGNTTVSGCTDPAAENYDPTATVDDNTCTYAPTCAGVHERISRQFQSKRHARRRFVRIHAPCGAGMHQSNSHQLRPQCDARRWLMCLAHRARGPLRRCAVRCMPGGLGCSACRGRWLLSCVQRPQRFGGQSNGNANV